MRRVVLFLGVLILAAVLVRWWPARKIEPSVSSPRPFSQNGESPAGSPVGDRTPKNPTTPPTPNATQGKGIGRPVVEGGDPSAPEMSSTGGVLAPPLKPETRMHFVRSILQDYRGAYGQNPVGSNAEITAALMGKNARRNQFLRSDDPNLNDRGELIDHWGSVYFLHQVSGKVMEIRSAGPDKTMWTADDLMVK